MKSEPTVRSCPASCEIVTINFNVAICIFKHLFSEHHYLFNSSLPSLEDRLGGG